MRKRRTFVRRFLCCIFHQHILVRAWGLEPQRIAAREPKGAVTSVKAFLRIQNIFNHRLQAIFFFNFSTKRWALKRLTSVATKRRMFAAVSFTTKENGSFKTL